MIIDRSFDRLSGALFSDDRTYRRMLWRKTGVKGPLLNVLLLNPSIADSERNDPTVARQIKRAALLGCTGGLIVTNAYDLVSTDPRGLKRHPEPCSPINDCAIAEAAQQAAESGGMCVAGWGTHCSITRQNQIRALFDNLKIPLLCLGQNEDGSPKHPLYISYSVRPVEWLYF
jgi:hypothetical protein